MSSPTQAVDQITIVLLSACQKLKDSTLIGTTNDTIVALMCVHLFCFWRALGTAEVLIRVAFGCSWPALASMLVT